MTAKFKFCFPFHPLICCSWGKLKRLPVILFFAMALLFTLLQGCIILPIPHQRTYAYGLEGWVVDELGTPIPHAIIVTKEGKVGGIEIIREAVTDSNGYFKVKPVKRWHGAYVVVLLNVHNGQPTGFSIFPDGYVPYSHIITFHAAGAPEQKSKAELRYGRWIDPQSFYEKEVARLQGNVLVFAKIMLYKKQPETGESP